MHLSCFIFVVVVAAAAAAVCVYVDQKLTTN